MTLLAAPPVVKETSPSHGEVIQFERRRQPSFRRGFQSVFVIAAALYAALSLYLAFNAPFDFDQYNTKCRGWAWWTINDLRSHPAQAHNVALLGSSLMISAASGCDANFLKKSVDLTEHHKAAYLDDMLTTRFGGKFNTFNLATPGQMPSDAFMMLKTMVNTADRPEIVIYGVAPRDFIDSTLSSPVDTEPFHYLKRIVNLDDVSEALFRNPISKLDFWLGKTAYFYKYSLDFEMALSDFCTSKMERLIPPDKNHPFTYWDRVKLLPQYLPGEIKPGAVMTDPIDRQFAKSHFTDNTADYVDRYHRPDKAIYSTQFYFLRKLTDYCQREKIELILVNMPITRQNVSILKPMWYLYYIQALREFSFYHNVPAFDLCEFDRYEHADYHDPVHLNAFGARKFFDRLVAFMASTERTATAFELAGEELERHAKIASLKVTPL